MRLVDLDAKDPYLLDGRCAIGILDNVPTEERPQGGCMTIICTEEQKKAIINAHFCPFVKDCPFYSTEHGAKYLSCKQCREDNIEWKKEN